MTCWVFTSVPSNTRKARRSGKSSCARPVKCPPGWNPYGFDRRSRFRSDKDSVKKKAPNKSTPPPKALLLLVPKTKMSKQQKADEIPLIPFGEFKTTVKKVLSASKAESDRELAEFQAKKREAKKSR